MRIGFVCPSRRGSVHLPCCVCARCLVDAAPYLLHRSVPCSLVASRPLLACAWIHVLDSCFVAALLSLNKVVHSTIILHHISHLGMSFTVMCHPLPAVVTVLLLSVFVLASSSQEFAASLVVAVVFVFPLLGGYPLSRTPTTRCTALNIRMTCPSSDTVLSSG